MGLMRFAALVVLVVLGVLGGPLAWAQAKPAFEVATVRVAKGDANDGSWSMPGTGSFTARNLPLTRLMMLAYGVNDDQIANKPAWLESDLFDVAAKPAAGVALSREELKPRLQALLEERFHLVTHTEIRQMPGYALVVAKSGAKLQPTRGAKFPGYRLNVSDGELNGLNWSMPFLAGLLQHPAGRPVVDKTGLAGSYDIKVDFAPEGSTDSALPSIFTALEETLGLRLEAAKVPVAFVVIDRVERVPVEN